MDPLLVLNAKPTTRYAYMVDGNDLLKTKCIPRGEQKTLLLPRSSLTASSYVEMLEHQQAQLVLGLQELYRRLQDGEPGDSGHLAEVFHDTPTTHELLEWLGALHHGEHDGPDKFYDDPYMMQAVAILENTDSAKRDASFSSIQSEMDPSTSFETEAFQTELDFPSLKESYASQASFVDSPQEFSVEPTLPLTYTTTVEPARSFSQVTWQQDLTNHSADFDAYKSWIYNTEAQIVNNA